MKDEKRPKILGAIVGVIGCAIAALSFAATYVFATKVELERSNGEIRADVATISGEVKVVKSEIKTIRSMQKEDRDAQRVIDQNLREQPVHQADQDADENHDDRDRQRRLPQVVPGWPGHLAQLRAHLAHELRRPLDDRQRRGHYFDSRC